MAGVHVVFVCSGNICRSPVAESVFRARLAEAGLADAVTVSSAGIGAWHAGEPMDRRAAATLRDRGYETRHTARQVDDEQLGADLLVAATADHVRDLVAAGADPERVVLLRAFDPEAPEGAEVPDPYYGGPDGFDEVIGMIEAAVPGLVERVRR
ncbi:low molecular weight protein-tyrosine-phosphatase [Actinomycetospora lemnae]|uniref:protein-tyrosine-phosphatase n=1 Tax=Actinomycetospora lemnae TaxID=3019891 RepID=A0ABT5SZI1_9PSEU|nr:low molecular weight protein-tyrosine-phosphatase [Actinomycetospora sp. DW7H6]MDD7968262.1 low molecular weight phosphotyrosine protein phosphatase [Actinomycetospora sp. DW7H6]